MKQLTACHVLAVTALLTFNSASGAAFTSGSTGSYGEMHITDDTTLDLPPSGVFNCTSITVDAGKTLRFSKNALNTPVYLLAQTQITINGTIDVSATSANGFNPGRGGPGGFDGGYGGFGNGDHNTGGAGLGQGGGSGGGGPFSMNAAYVDGIENNQKIYGNVLLSPLLGGSGGGGSNGNPGAGGAGGGGAVLLGANESITLAGLIRANGGSGFGGGSGGSIRLVSPLVQGTGRFDVSGGASFLRYGGSQGRVRIDCVDRYAFRNLVMAGKATQGSQMFVFPAIERRLDIIQAAGQTIPAPASAGVQVTLPAGSTPNRQVTVAASGFAANVPVPITLVVSPETGAAISYDADIPIGADQKGQVTVDVVLSIGNISQIHAWTR